MEAKEKPTTKLCRYCKSEIPYDAKVCPQCRKRLKGGKLKWVLLAVAAVLVIAIVGGSGGENDEPEKVGTVADAAQTEEQESGGADTAEAAQAGDTVPAENAAEESEAAETQSAEAVQSSYQVGDILQDGDMKIVYMSSGVYSEENEFLQPEDGKQYIYAQFAFENTSETDSDSISFYSFTCYADGYAADAYYGGEDDLSAALSPGRATSGYLYFEVPEDAENIEIEYETNWLTEKKITFLYEGEQDSGYVLEGSDTPTAGAFAVGDTAEAGDLTITYLSCEEDTSYSDYLPPRDGYYYLTCTFEFENTGESDEYVSFYDFDAYADGVACAQSYFRDDSLSDTLSAGRKAQGTVTFEVPKDAAVAELEYVSNYWTSDRIVFTMK